MNHTDLVLQHETEASRRLLQGLQDLGEDDPVLRQDMVEGQTCLLEAIGQALGEVDECNIMIAGIRAQEVCLAERRERINKRREILNALIEQAMLSTQLTSVRLPTATLSVVRRPRALDVICEADIPARFWVLPEPPAPRLDRKAVLAALNGDEPVPGAVLADVSYSLTVRRK